MKKVRVLVSLILCFAMIFAMAGCGEKKPPVEEENILCGIMNWQVAGHFLVWYSS